MTPELLDSATGCGPIRARIWAPPLTDAMSRFTINTSRRQAAFLAQVAHESDAFSVVIESMNYSAEGLLATFPKHFTVQEANDYAHQPVRIASRVYANRMGNGDEASGDGWTFRGRGPLQTTGRDDYRDIGAALGFDLLANPAALIQPGFGCLAAAWEWNRGRCSELADLNTADAFTTITRTINGGLIGQADRVARWEKVKHAMGLLA